MEHGFGQPAPGARQERVPLFPGISIAYIDFPAGPPAMRHMAAGHTVQIDHCKAGQAVWETERGSSIFLNPGDFSLHMQHACAGPAFQFPTGQYQGLTIWIDLQEASARPPELVAETGIFNSLLRDSPCGGGAVAFFEGNQQTEGIFTAFYSPPGRLKLAYQRIKALELLLYLAQLGPAPQNRLSEYRQEQVQTVREIHDHLLGHMGQRFTIEELARQYLINPTTLKAVFKSVYGASLAAHIKEHRMEQAAQMLRQTDKSIAEVARAVGYDSQSKFSAAFKEVFAALPSVYRKQGRRGKIR